MAATKTMIFIKVSMVKNAIPVIVQHHGRNRYLTILKTPTFLYWVSINQSAVASVILEMFIKKNSKQTVLTAINRTMYIKVNRAENVITAIMKAAGKAMLNLIMI